MADGGWEGPVMGLATLVLVLGLGLLFIVLVGAGGSSRWLEFGLAAVLASVVALVLAMRSLSGTWPGAGAVSDTAFDVAASVRDDPSFPFVGEREVRADCPACGRRVRNTRESFVGHWKRTCDAGGVTRAEFRDAVHGPVTVADVPTAVFREDGGDEEADPAVDGETAVAPDDGNGIGGETTVASDDQRSTDRETTVAPDDLTAVSGVGPAKAEALADAGYTSVADLRRASEADLVEADGIGDALAARIKADVGDAGGESGSGADTRVGETDTDDETGTAVEESDGDDPNVTRVYDPDDG